MSEKRKWREKVLKCLRNIDGETFEADCRMIRDKLFEQREWREAKVIALTLSRGREIDTLPIIQEGWRQQKIIALPACDISAKKLIFRRTDSFDQLSNRSYGLLEPNDSETAPVDKQTIDLVIVPGVVFDRLGYRIGYGGGYYDRFLENFKSRTLSLLLDEQLKDRIPVEPYDRPVNKLVTPTQIVEVKTGR
ncbi:5-formyltetrahydrofolate cyclo-ligase [Terrilactibacillus sp. S3-3]|nr:5-formyltetrahydrofolate cyclo-ligase [Terrilactibacillus sp. S3-3]